MAIETARPQITKLLDNDTLSRLGRMRVNTRRHLTSRGRGEHLHGKGGSSVEFADFRNYVPGDDLRYLDWNIFSRLHRPYLELYHLEEQMHVVILVDASSSMLFEGKLDRAKQLAAAFGIMGLFNIERVSVWACHSMERRPYCLTPCTGRVSMRRVLRFVEDIEGGGDLSVEGAVDHVLQYHRGRGAAILLSDFLTFGDVQRAANRLFSAGLEIFGVQILSPAEIDPQVTGDLRLVDSETAGTLDVTAAGDLLGIYQEHRAGFEAELEGMCRQRGGRFIALNCADPLEWVLFDLLKRKGWVQ